ncbi:Arc family DNA-binding protein [candidate division KSB1 bacterium]|nr:Arc family DNA-binding protein [candidate division KSB1 bacterium]
MANITVKNIPNDLYERLKDVAANNHRSLNNEIIVCIEKAVKSRRLDKEQSLDRIRKLRKLAKLPRLSEEQLRQIRDEGRL